METNNILPKDITKDKFTNEEYASFSYYDGIELADLNGWKQSNYMEYDRFIVCCGDVMIKVKSTDFPQVERREI